MVVKFFLIVNRHGQTRLGKYYGTRPEKEERQKLESEVIRQCVSRSEQTSFCFHCAEQKVIYKRYLAIYCIAGVDESMNELSVLALFDFYFQTLREYFGDITEFLILYKLAEAYTALNEIIVDGVIVETSRQKIISALNAVFV